MKRLILVAAVLALAMVPALALGSVAAKKTLTASLTGSVEVPPGAPNGSGTATITLNDQTGKVCWKFTGLKKLQGAANAAHIHKGKAGVAGAVVVPFGATFKLQGCTTVDASLVKKILAHPGRYYVNVHNVKYPAGAVRGQLRAA
jgi:hypothetical protein